jgi:hypothetical protein
VAPGSPLAFRPVLSPLGVLRLGAMSALHFRPHRPLRLVVHCAAITGTDERLSLKRALRLSKSKNHFFAHSSLQL